MPAAGAVFGAATNEGSRLVPAYDTQRHRLAVGAPFENVVTLPSPDADEIFSSGFE